MLPVIVGGVAALVGVALSQGHEARLRAVSEASKRLGLTWNGQCFRGVLDGVEVLVTIGMASGVRVRVLLARPFEFEFTLRYACGRPDTQVIDDPNFNNACQIKTPAPERTLAALTSKELRSLIAEFLAPGDYRWTTRITQSEVTAQVCDARSRGAESVRAAIAAAVAIAYRFDHR